MDESLGAAALAFLCVTFAIAAWARRREPHVRDTIGSLAASSRASTSMPGEFLAKLGRRWLGTRPAPAPLRRRCELAGVRRSVEWIVGVKVGSAAGGAMLGSALAWIAPPAAPVVATLALLGYRAPDFALARRARRRQQQVEAHVPDLVELLVATTEAGLSPSVAFRRSATVVRGPLGEELDRAMAEMDLGVPWAMAMEQLVDRTDVPSLRRLVSALSRSNRLGTSVRTALRSVAGDLRAERRVHAEEVARRAPVKMLFPLVFLILPAFLLLTVGPVVMATIQSLRSGG